MELEHYRTIPRHATGHERLAFAVLHGPTSYTSVNWARGLGNGGSARIHRCDEQNRGHQYQ
jgi:hypothetical protein